jgi:hypothetical protein
MATTGLIHTREWPTIARVRPITDKLADAYERLERLRRECDRLVAGVEGLAAPEARAVPDGTGPSLEDVGALAVLVDRVEAYLDQLADEIEKVRLAMARAAAFVPLTAAEPRPDDAA